jgi:hypothetical protein
MTLFCLGFKSNQILILILIGSNSASLSLQYYLSIAKGMQKKILIPIDFRIESLNTLKYALEERKQEKSTIILMYSAYISDSITDLLFYDPAKITKALASTDFNDAIAIISNTYESSLHSIEIELFNGINKNKHSIYWNIYYIRKVEIIELLSGKIYIVDILPLEKSDYKSITQSRYFFKWKEELEFPQS